MKVTLNWLKEYVDFDYSADDLSHRLTMTGLEVDAMERLGEGLDTVIVARLADVQQHPDADRLTVCTVDTGSATQQVVCGAKNHKTGDLIALLRLVQSCRETSRSKSRRSVARSLLACSAQ